MTIPTVSISAANGLPHSQPAALTARAASVPDPVSKTPAANAAADARADEAAKPGVKQVQQSLEDINKVLAGFSISVQFKIDPDYKELIVKVVDLDSGKLIRQIPTEEVVTMAKAMDNLKGLLFAQSV